MTTHPIKKDLTIYKGAVFDEQFEYVEDDEVTPIDLTGMTMRMQVRATFDAAAPIVELTTENGGIEITDAAEGRFHVTILAPDTEDLDPIEDAVYDLEVIPAAGEDFTFRLLMGKMRILDEATHD